MLLALGGCTLAVVSADGGKPQLSVWPLGLRVSRGDAAAVSVSASTVGMWSGCYTAGVGFTRIDCDVIDIGQCSAALVHAPLRDPKLLNRLAKATAIECPKPEGEPCSEPSCSLPPY